MKKLTYILLSLTAGVIISCSSNSTEDPSATMTCAEAETAVVSAFNNALNLGTEASCRAYREAVIAQATPCSYDDNCLENLLDQQASCLNTGSAIDIGS